MKSKEMKAKHLSIREKNDEQSIKMLNNKLRQENLNSVVNVDDVNIAYDNFIKLFQTYYDECCPIKKIYLNNKKNKTWMTSSLKNACTKTNTNT